VADRLPTAAQVQQALAEVYARPEFREQKHGFGEWLMQKLAAAVQWIGRHLSWLSELRHTNPTLFLMIVVWLVATALAIVVHLVWTAVQVARRGEATPAGDAGGKKPKPRTAADWEAEAARLAADGKLREAAAALYQALLLRLDAVGVVRFDASKTPGDYRREARKHPEAARALGGFLRIFEPVAFGGRALDGEGWERLRAAAAEGPAHG
jgi:hypothetical protein